MKNGLTGSFVDVDADVVAIGMEALVNLLFHILEHHIHGFAFVIGEIERTKGQVLSIIVVVLTCHYDHPVTPS